MEQLVSPVYVYGDIIDKVASSLKLPPWGLSEPKDKEEKYYNAQYDILQEQEVEQ